MAFTNGVGVGKAITARLKTAELYKIRSIKLRATILKLSIEAVGLGPTLVL